MTENPTPHVKRPTRLLMCLGPAVLCSIDVAVTLAGQPPEYWAGNFHRAVEGNPIPRWFLQQHPLAMVAGCLLWITLFSAAIHYLSKPTARVVALALMVSHAVGVSTWLIRMPLGVGWCVAVFLVAKYFDRFIWRD